MHRVHQALGVFLLMLASAPAWAADITVSGTIRYWDSRTDRDNDSFVTGAAGKNAPAYRVKVYLYDQDGGCRDADLACGSENDDDLLGTTYTSTSDGSYSFTIPDTEHDVYLLTKYESDDTDIKDDDGNRPTSISGTTWNLTFNLIKNWNITCSNDIRNVTAGQCDNQSDVDMWFTLNEGYANTLQSAVDTDFLVNPDTLYHPNGHSAKITYHIPKKLGSSCTGAHSINCNDICVATSSTDDNHVIAHETGHALHRRMVDVCDTKISWCNGGHSWSSLEGEMCATSEGFAWFFAGRGHRLGEFNESDPRGKD